MRFVGESIPRVEDPRILTGQGRFVDDLALPNMLHASFVRSTVPHAHIVGVDASAARAMPGVAAVLTADDLATIAQPLRQVGPPGLRTPTFHALAAGVVRFVGDPVALVVADSRYRAEDACDAVVVDYDSLPAVTSVAEALAPGAARLYDELDDNVAHEERFSAGDVEGAFARADRLVTHTLRQHRIANVPMETRGGVASYTPTTGELVYHASHKSPQSLRLQLARVLGTAVAGTHVVIGDVGGSFGQKGQTGRDDLAVCAASVLLGRPVKWIEDRAENLMAGGQAKDDTLELSVAVIADGTILGLRARMLMDAGAYPNLPFPISLYPTLVRLLLPGPYRIDAYEFDATVAFTNKDHYVSYRGPWSVETWGRERVLDIVARELGLDRVDVRRRNLLTDDELPRPMVSGPPLSHITARQTLDRAVEVAGYDSIADEQRRARADGRVVGFGLATFIEIAPGPPEFARLAGFDIRSEKASARVEPDGRLTVFTGQAPHGQGHQTTLAQVAADELGVPFDRVTVVYGDTRTAPFSMLGTGGSRSATMGSGAAIAATRRVREQVLAVAAERLEASPDDLEIVDAVVSVRGTPSASMTLAEVATVAYMAPSLLPPGQPLGIEASCDYEIPSGGWAQATHCCWVEIDPETGVVRIPRYLVVEDCGTLINPAIVEGQVRGGVAQGIGAVLYERATYDDDGQFRSATFMDYLVPTAMEIPDIEIEHLESPPTGPSTSGASARAA